MVEINQKLSTRPVSAEDMVEFLNRELVPVVEKIRRALVAEFTLDQKFLVSEAAADLANALVLTAGTNITLTPGAGILTVAAQSFGVATTLTGAANTLALVHANMVVPVSHTVATALTVPPYSSVAFPLNTYILPWQTGVGLLSFVAGAGVTIQKPATMVAEAAEQYSLCGLLHTSLNNWLLLGDAGLA
jgi:hypothetical protein